MSNQIEQKSNIRREIRFSQFTIPAEIRGCVHRQRATERNGFRVAWCGVMRCVALRFDLIEVGVGTTNIAFTKPQFWFFVRPRIAPSRPDTARATSPDITTPNPANPMSSISRHDQIKKQKRAHMHTCTHAQRQTIRWGRISGLDTNH